MLVVLINRWTDDLMQRLCTLAVAEQIGLQLDRSIDFTTTRPLSVFWALDESRSLM